MSCLHFFKAPRTQSEERQDYEKYLQKNIVSNFNDKRRFYNRGHLTPNDAFDIANERDLTFVNTNIAPQWVMFNGGNWNVVENAVKTYSNKYQRKVYVVTGTGGEIMKLNNRVTVPAFFWKAVCDPEKRESIVFVAKNPSGKEGTERQGGCPIKDIRKQMTPVNGIIKCSSLDDLKRRKEAKYFKLPSFGEACQPSKKGTFLDQFLSDFN
ncbi:neurogenic locus notch homolog 1-like [Paramuricea clavata]|uniref:Neurogenic locus notch homolog 1-like n=1 Tax=Paramuricea clavata TaxID=317549 RepID=A0A7D9L8D8_PARCT|nr:neurogenic locus notch homolog 1-like [Paramuricea clavata]